VNDRTKLIHSGRSLDPATGASSIPIYQTSTFAQPDPEHPGPYDYARSGNPTREALEHTMAVLEGGTQGLAFSSGMAATSSVLLLFKPGDHLVVGNDIYGGTYRVLTGLFKRWQLEVTFTDSTDPDSVRKAVTPATKALFIETPANPLLSITDLRAMVEIAREHSLLAITDNTFMTPALQRPLDIGFDIVVHSATKFLGGHSDLIAGVAVTREETLGRHLKAIQNSFGAILGPQDSWLVQRGIKTLGVRMDAQQKTAGELALWLSHHPAVGKVHYPGLKDHPGRAVHESQSQGAGAVLSFELAGKPDVLRLLKQTKLAIPAVSLGGVESILSYPAMMSHAAMPRPERLARGITDGLVRLSVGLETAEDLIADLDSALKQTE
jgi:cystathionine beta-lyase